MANFDASFLNPKMRKATGGSDYGFLIDQLDIKQSQLESDGKLSPGDYDLLNGMAQKVYSHPGLSPAQRSNIEVKMANYSQKKSQTKIKDSTDVSDMNNELENDFRKSSIGLGDDPKLFLEGQKVALSEKVNKLANSIDIAENNGSNSSGYYTEYIKATDELKDTLSALDYVQSYQDGTPPSSGFAAYIDTNDKGQIRGVKVVREGSISGYLETNGLYGGLKIYGKRNKKENGENVFLLGPKTFKAVDSFIPGPDGSFKNNILADSSMGSGNSEFSTSPSSYVNVKELSTQKATNKGDFVKGSSGFIYKDNGDGTYIKYVNSTPENIGAASMFKVPRSFEDSIIPNVTQTVDGSATADAPVPMTMFSQPAGPAPAAPETVRNFQDSQMKSTPNTGGAPEVKSPQSSQGIAQKAYGVAKGFLGKLFGN